MDNMTEQEIANEIERLCGGAHKAERLNWIWRSTFGVCDRIGRFRKIAELEGFSKRVIKLFLTGD